MRILYITETFQHPLVRGSTRSYHLPKQLSLRHKITLLTIARASIPPAALSEMTNYLEEIHVAATIPVVDAANFREANFRRERNRQKCEAVKRLKQAFLKLVTTESYDLILLHGASIAPVIEDWDDLPIVIDIGDANSERLFASLRYTNVFKWPSLWWHYRSVREVEQQLLKKSPYITFISCRDRNAFIGKRKGAPVVPIGVDLNFWTRQQSHAPANTIIFTGVMDYQPNDDAALYLIDKIVPLIRKSISDIKILIVGRNPSAALAEKAKQHRHILVTGFVEDMRPYLEQATVFVAPLRFASGTQNKVLEALAMQVPVVCTSMVAEGLYFDDLRDPPVYVANRAKPFARAVIDLLRNEEKRSRLAAQGENSFGSVLIGRVARGSWRPCVTKLSRIARFLWTEHGTTPVTYTLNRTLHSVGTFRRDATADINRCFP